jgi:hypothetical protein
VRANLAPVVWLDYIFQLLTRRACAVELEAEGLGPRTRKGGWRGASARDRVNFIWTSTLHIHPSSSPLDVNFQSDTKNESKIEAANIRRRQAAWRCPIENPQPPRSLLKANIKRIHCRELSINSINLECSEH